MDVLKRVAKNEAMKNDPKEIYNWRVYVLTCSAWFAGALFGMDTGATGGVLNLDTFQIGKANLQANIDSTLQAGCFVGALAAYWFADKIGRKPSLMYSAHLALIGVNGYEHLREQRPTGS
ncbi:hypothetical protein L211DRAFT_845194 [Terfezia boudieri ATCC MYA-4762]|uniref:Major facilitator superfamily (MFS) profile domain-containing protein n=1 Tax=Terfezia boudieri ATCC MYA-4762 TaxID=1051890 RepID=A0A3N4M5R3_9PEZI|nr:hypothetical protein L211DRAFT_845194 [Terfezia boudieri ATCC MYA-4762]